MSELMRMDCPYEECGTAYTTWTSSDVGFDCKPPENLPIHYAYCCFCPNRPKDGKYWTIDI